MRGSSPPVMRHLAVVPPRPDILILLHERDRWAERENYLIWPIRDAWQELGLRVEIARGPRQAVPAHLLFPHVDLTVTPPEIAALFGRYPRVVNRRVLDISKRRLSRLLLPADDPWQGPVIVKTNLNTGGLPESRLARPPAAQFARMLAKRVAPRRWLLRWRARRRAAPTDLGTARTLPPNFYPIFTSKAAVPRGAFDNPALVVERFLPEKEGDLFAVRSWSFLGSCGYNLRRVSRSPVVRAVGVLRREEVPVPDDLIGMRADLGFDYGKLDYVLRDGRAVLLDANRTPSLSGDSLAEAQRERARTLALGVAAWIDRSILEASPSARP
jgi:hypothetical protein